MKKKKKKKNQNRAYYGSIIFDFRFSYIVVLSCDGLVKTGQNELNRKSRSLCEEDSFNRLSQGC